MGRYYRYKPEAYKRRRKKIRAAQNKWYRENRSKVLGWQKRYYLQNKSKVLAKNERGRKLRMLDPEYKTRARLKYYAWRAKNSARLKVWLCAWRKKNPDKVLAYRKLDSQKHGERIRTYFRARDRKSQLARDNRYLMRLIRRRVLLALHGKRKSASTLALIGCQVQNLREHLESQFRDGMSWGNYGAAWVIDHKRPCCSFDLSKPEEQRKCFHFSNLRPLEKFANNSKATWDRKLSLRRLA